MKKVILSTVLLLPFCTVFGQKSSQLANYFDNPIVVDSASTIIIPTRYNSEFLSSNKIEFWGDLYANIVFYNFNKDSYKKLFENDTYIMSFSNRYNSYGYDNRHANRNITASHLFYKVKNVDHNKNGRIDNNDPAILYVSDIDGNNLKPLTPLSENVVSFDIFEKQNIVLIKMQRDLDNDLDFENSDKDFYYIKLNLTTLTFGNRIEINTNR